MQTRWHVDDLAGRMIAASNEYINLPAISPAGTALWEARRPLVWLEERRRIFGEYSWSSLYQGAPRPRGSAVFREPHYFTEKPRQAYRVSIGADFAYTTKTHADYSVAVVMAEANGFYYILDVYRRQVEAPAFGGVLKPLQSTYSGAKVTAFVGGTEKGITDFMKQQGVRMDAIPAVGDKFSRAQPIAAAWNAGRVLIQQGAPWAAEFVAEVCGFTGVKDRHDDCVDALAGAFHTFSKPANVRLVEGAGW
jgi:predicted phage terminase large subunit-like protein